ncbi:hypothetical protein L1987_74916 [Smallanthus sonchifolius]|uniref:Uncharacterized protein n=1 Tax=Smallanthus sonchifolius TaxID=185202 RepID=A0ACB9A400_9ASTR|nr:hypothetical protein L1987_74916 [Smallanthus sonchifolius]
MRDGIVIDPLPPPSSSSSSKIHGPIVHPIASQPMTMKMHLKDMAIHLLTIRPAYGPRHVLDVDASFSPGGDGEEGVGSGDGEAVGSGEGEPLDSGGGDKIGASAVEH